ncbi:hypothetical protein J3E72DRAFT_380010 [Bipolaris maydis]|nr:hypothetical protein J3E74DRAFT_296019 [Bipolaris maydis]KAJ5052546.1 hypothetical protein J3E74DRAFT_295639 [Bipolaris maydis]KAJ6192226.1 hypothetical protein J3E72DRAFT_380010 [Bipolaris maydis]
MLNIGFERLLMLAQATNICIYFDTCWLGENTAEFQEIVRSSQAFVGVPLIPQFTSLYQKADWQILNFILAAERRTYIPSEDSVSEAILSIERVSAEAPPSEDAIHDNPPPYAHDNNMLGKRSRPDSSLTLDAQDLKRARGHSCSSSETELATPAPSLRAESTASSTATVPADLFQEAVTSAVEKVLSPMLEKKLVQLVREELPRVVAELFRETPTGQSPSQCLSPASPCNRIPNVLTHHDATSTHHPTLNTMINEAVQKALKETWHEPLDRHHQSITISLDEHSEDLRIGLEASHEDHMFDCNDKRYEMEAEFNQHLLDALDAFVDIVDKVVENCLNKFGDTISNQVFFRRGDALVASKQSQRATSLPVSTYDNKRIAEGA